MWIAQIFVALLPCFQDADPGFSTSDVIALAKGETHRQGIELDFEGTLFLWAEPRTEGSASETDPPPVLRVFIESEPGVPLREASTVPGGDPAWTQLAVHPQMNLELGLECLEDGLDPANPSIPPAKLESELRVASSVESAATLEAQRSGAERRAAVQQLRNEDPTAAREACIDLIDELLALEGSERSGRVTDLLWNLGYDVYGLGDAAAAARAWEHVVAYRRATRPESHDSVLHARASLAVAWESLGSLSRALETQREIYRLRSSRTGDDPVHREMAMQNISNMLSRLGEFDEAIELQQELITLRRARLPEEHPDLLAARMNMAGTQVEVGNILAGRDELIDILAIRERNLPPNDIDLQRARLNLSHVYLMLGNLSGARELQEQALSVLSRQLPETHPTLQRIRLGLASTLFYLGETSDALALQQRVVEIRRSLLDPDHPDLMIALTDTAISLKFLGRVDEALALELELEKRLDARANPKSLVELRLLGNLATSLSLDGQHGEALELLLLVQERFSQCLPPEHRSRRSVDYCLLHTLISMGRFDRALDELEATAERATRAFDIVATQGSIADASPFGTSFTHIVSIAWTLALEREAPGFEALDSEHRARAARCAFELTEGVRSLPGRSAQMHRTSLVHADGPALWERWSNLSSEVASLAGDASQVDAFRRALRDRNQVANQLRGLREGSGRFQDHDFDRIRTALLDDEALISTRVFQPWRPDSLDAAPRRLGVLVVRKDRDPVAVDLGPEVDLEGAVAAWYASLGEPTEDGRGVVPRPKESGPSPGPAAARDLVLRLVAPIEGALAGVHRCLLLPDGPLHAVPVDVLPDPGTPGALLGQRYRWSRLASLDSLHPSGSGPVNGGSASLLAVGAIEYGESSAEPAEDRGSFGTGFAPLPGTSRELKLIQELHREAHPGSSAAILTGHEATAEAFLEATEGAQMLHVATHGYFVQEGISDRSDGEPLDAQTLLLEGQSTLDLVTSLAPSALCGLAFAGATPGERIGPEADGTRGIVTASELATLDLRNCRLAVLSACESQLGVYGEGLGIHSLQAALHTAGAHETIASLWNVPDDPTAILMGAFYEGLWRRNLPPDRALWEAKLLVRAQHPDPLAWAGWVYTGRPRE